jgi:hypothetical protein
MLRARIRDPEGEVLRIQGKRGLAEKLKKKKKTLAPKKKLSSAKMIKLSKAIPVLMCERSAN